MLARIITLITIIFFTLLINIIYGAETIIYKCGRNNLKIKPRVLKKRIPIKKRRSYYKRKLDIDTDGFKNFSIHLDLTNIEKDIERYNLNEYKNLFISSFSKVINTLQTLLKEKAIKI